MGNKRSNRLFVTSMDMMCQNQKNSLHNPVDMFCSTYELKHAEKRIDRVDVDPHFANNNSISRYNHD